MVTLLNETDPLLGKTHGEVLCEDILMLDRPALDFVVMTLEGWNCRSLLIDSQCPDWIRIDSDLQSLLYREITTPIDRTALSEKEIDVLTSSVEEMMRNRKTS